MSLELSDIVVGKTYRTNLDYNGEGVDPEQEKYHDKTVVVVGKDSPDTGLPWPVEVMFVPAIPNVSGSLDFDPSELVEV